MQISDGDSVWIFLLSHGWNISLHKIRFRLLEVPGKKNGWCLHYFITLGSYSWWECFSALCFFVVGRRRLIALSQCMPDWCWWLASCSLCPFHFELWQQCFVYVFLWMWADWKTSMTVIFYTWCTWMTYFSLCWCEKLMIDAWTFCFCRKVTRSWIWLYTDCFSRVVKTWHTIDMQFSDHLKK